MSAAFCVQAQPVLEVSFSSVLFEAPETAGVVSITVQVDSPAPAGGLAVSYTVGADTDANTADADGDDYTDLGGGAVTILAGESTTTIRVRINDDDEIEALRERFTLSLVPSDRYMLGAQHTATVVIEEGVCDVTPQVRDEYLREYNESPGEFSGQTGDQFDLSMGTAGCSDVAEAVTYQSRISFFGKGITRLKPFDFLHLRWGEGPLAEGTEPRFEIDLEDNQLTGLPEDVFRGQGDLTHLDLQKNSLNSLSAAVFRDLSNLRRLFLNDNQLDSLPPGILSGLSNLGLLWLQDNPGEPFRFELAFEPPSLPSDFSGSTEVRLVLAEGAPRRIEAVLSVVGGALSSPRVSLAIGSTQSGVFTLTRDDGDNPFLLTQQNLVISGGIPGFRESSLYKGFEIVSGPALELEGTITILAGLDDAVAVEGATAEVTLTLGRPTPAPLTIAYVLGADDNPATADADGSDYTDLGGGTVTVPAGENTAAIRIRIDDDDEIEPPRERFTVSLVSTGDYVLVSPAPGGDRVLASPSTAAVVIEEGVCDRTPVVRDEIMLRALRDNSDATRCHEVDDLTRLNPIVLDDMRMTFTELQERDLTGLTGLEDLTIVISPQLVQLPEQLFSDLDSLERLTLSGTGVTELPAGLFSGLDTLNTLSLLGNQLSELPAGLFLGLDALVTLDLPGNLLSTLPASLFAGLGSLQDLRLDNNQLSELPAGLFAGLGNLQDLQLDNNRLSELPAGLFSGLTNLRRASFGRQRIVLALQFQRLDRGAVPDSAELRLVVVQGAPFEIVADLSAEGGTVLPERVTIPTGATMSAVFAATRTGGTPFTVNLDEEPQAPTGDRYAGLSTTLSEPFSFGHRVEFLQTEASAAEGGSAELRFGVVSAPPAALSVFYSIGADADDYTDPGGGVATIAAGETFATILIEINDDDEIEPLREQFTVSLVPDDRDDRYTLGAQSTATVVIEEGVCDVTPQVRDVYLVEYNEGGPAGDQFGLSGGTAGCSDVAEAVTFEAEVHLDNKGITRLKALDFSHIQWRDVLPAVDDTFEIDLSGNQLTGLPEGIFRGQEDDLIILSLGGNHLSSLSATVFRNLPNLERLYLNDNRLDGLPDGIFSGLGNLEQLRLQNNPGAPFQFELRFEPATLPDDFSGSTEVRLVLAEGAPRRVAATLSIIGGALSSPMAPMAPMVRLETGSTQSDAFTVTRSSVNDVFVLEQQHLRFGGADSDYPGFDIVPGAALVHAGPVSVELGDAAAVEGATPEVAVTLGKPLPATLTVAYVLGPDDDPATADADGADYTDLGGGMVTIPAGESTAAIRIRIDDDAEIEPLRERFTVSVVPGDGYVLASPGTATVVIEEGVCDRTPRVRNRIAHHIRGTASTTVQCHQVDDLTGVNGDETFWLSGGLFTELQERDFAGLTGVTRVLIRNNSSLMQLPAQLFSELESLTELGLTDNALTELPTGLFSGLDKLSNLSLHGNQLSELPAGLFSGLDALVTLGLQENRLSTLPASLFAGLRNLQDLRLDNNQLSELPASLFAGLGNLQNLRLDNNQLSELPASLFAGLGNLQDLRLDDNQLSELPAGLFAGLANLSGANFDGQNVVLTLEFQRVDLGDVPGTAELRLVVVQGAPFEIVADLSAEGGTASPGQVTIPTGATMSAVFAVTQIVRTPVVVGLTEAPRPPAGYAGLSTTLRESFSFDDRPPAPAGLAIVSTPASGDSYEPGETIRFEVRFIEGVTVRTTSGAPELLLALGEGERTAIYDAGRSGGDTLAFGYRVADGDYDEDGVGVATDGLRLNGARISDRSGNVASAADLALTEHAILNAAGHKVQHRTVEFSPPVAAAPEGEPAELILRVSSASTSGFSVLYNLGIDDDANTADADVADYTDPGGGTVTVAAGETTAAILIGIADDDEIEPTTEILVVSLTPPSGDDYALGGAAAATVVIQEGVCDRTPAVRDAIVSQLRRLDPAADQCHEAADLARVLAVNVFNEAVTELQENDFAELTGLSSLLLTGNKSLERLPERLFSDQAALGILFLSNNALTELPPGIFSGLDRLHILHLSGNRLLELPPGLFAGLGQLRRLELGENPLTGLPAGLFSNLDALQELDLRAGGLGELPPGAFSDLENLRRLSLSGNSLMTLSQDAFSGLVNLQTLLLDDNALSVLPKALFAGIVNLNELSLDGNPSPTFTLRTLREPPESSGTAVIRLSVEQGAPFETTVNFSVEGGTVFPAAVTIPAGSTVGDSFVLTQAGGPAVTVRYQPAIPETRCLSRPCYRGIAFGGDRSFMMDELPPAVAGVEFVSAPENGAAYEPGETIMVAVRFDEEIVLAGGDPTLALEIGAVERVAAYAPDQSSTDALVFSYRLTTVDSDPDGVSVSADALSLNGAWIRDLLGSIAPDADLSLAGFEVSDDPGHRVRRRSVGIELSDTAPREGELVRVVFRASSTPASSLAVSYVIGTDGDANTADADGDDYAGPSSGTVTIAAGKASTAVAVRIIDDAEVEPSTEILVVSLVPPPGDDYVLGAPAAATAVIREGTCDRTALIRQAIGDAIGGGVACADVTEAHLRRVTNLDLGAPAESLRVTELKQNDFLGLAEVGVVDLRGNLLRTLEAGAFAGLDRLQTLILDDNPLSSLTGGSFSGLGSLRRLSLNGTRPAALTADVFSGIGELRRLSLERSLVTALSADLFSRVGKLRFLTLGDNALEELPPGLFSGLGELQELRLQNNRLRALPPGLLSGLENLAVLFLYGNSLEALPRELFSGLANLRRLRLDGNRLSVLPKDLFAGLDLDELWLQNNLGPTLSLRTLRAAATSSGIASARLMVEQGAPFEIVSDLAIRSGVLAPALVTIPAGSTVSDAFTLRQTGSSPTTVQYHPQVPETLCSIGARFHRCYRGVEFGGDASFTLDDFSPVLRGVDVVSAPANGAAYEPGEVITVTVRFDEEVRVSGAPFLRLEIGTDERLAVYDPGASSPDAAAFSYRLTVVDSDPDGISVISEEIEIGAGAGITDFAGLDAQRSLAGHQIVDDPAHKVRRRTAELGPVRVQTAEGRSIELAVTLSSGPGAPVTVGLGVGGDSDPHTDDAEPEDYTVLNDGWSVGLSSGVTTFAAGSTIVAFRIDVGDDEDVEPTSESFTVFLTPPLSDDYILGPQAAAVVVIEEGVCDRSPAVRQNIVDIINDPNRMLRYRVSYVQGCTDVTARHLNAIPSLDISGEGLSSLKRNDFLGFYHLTALHLRSNRLTSLPLGTFVNLPRLTLLDMTHNQLSGLPAGGVFSLGGLRQLFLGNNRLSNLPDNVFAGLRGLEELRLQDNQLAELPAGMFAGLHQLRQLLLHDNPGAAFGLNIEFKRVSGPESFTLGPAEIQLTSREGAPFPMVVLLSVEGGTLTADRVTFETGGTQTASFVVDLAPGSGMAVVTVGEPFPQAPETRCDLGLCYSSDTLEVVAGRPFIFDNTRPAAVAGLEIISPPQTGVYLAGKADERVTVAITFDESVIVIPSSGGRHPLLLLEIGGTERGAAYDQDASAGNRLVFSYALEPGDRDDDGISVSEDALRLNGAAVIDRSLDNADLSLDDDAFSNRPDLKVLPVSFDLSLRPAVVEVEEGGTAEFIVGVSPPSRTTLVVGYQAGIAGDTADAEDYAAAAAVEVVPGAVTGRVEIPIGDDDEIEPPRESFTLHLTGLVTSALYTVVFPSSGKVVIKEGVCDRTAAVRDQIVAGIAGVVNCADVTAADLAAIESLFVAPDPGDPPVLSALKMKDFEGLSGLEDLDLSRNDLPALPAGVFSGLGDLRHLFLYENHLRRLPPGLLSDLRDLEELSLRNNRLEALPPDAFSGLDQLETLLLSDNRLARLPAGAFAGLTALTMLHLQNQGAAGRRLDLVLGFERAGTQGATDPDADLRLTLLEGAPFDVHVGLVVEEGTVSPANQVTLIKGSTRSGTFTLRRTGEQAALSLTPPPLPVGDSGCGQSVCYRGFEIVFRERHAFVLNALAPRATGVAVVSVPARDGAYTTGAGGETITAEVYFNEEVVVTTPAVTLALEIGDSVRFALYRPELSSTDRLVFTYAPTFYDFDPDGISIASDALALNGARIMDRSLSDAELSLSDAPYAILDAPGHKVRRSFFELSYAATQVEVLEGETAELAVRVRPRTESALTVAYAVAADTASTADYSDAGGGVLTIAPDSVAGLVRVAVINDETVEPPRESFRLVLPEPQADDGYVLVHPSSARVVIREGVCDRTAQVRDAIVAAVGATDCADVTGEGLAGFDGKIDLSRQGISVLKQDDFSGLVNLRSLYLHGNDLRSLPDGVFSSLAGLGELLLQRNRLRLLPPGVFSRLTASTNLNLSDNRLSELPPGVFSQLGDLRQLALSRNPLGDLPADTFSNLAALESLRLSDVGMKRLPAGVFSNLIRLQRLDLDGNRLGELPAAAFPDSSALEVLSLSNNRIGELSPAMLPRLAGLRRLLLDGNRLSRLPREMFAEIPMTLAVDLSGNPGAPFGLKLRFERADDADPAATASAQVRLTLAEGAPFEVPVALERKDGETAFGPTVISQVTIPKGSTQTDVITVTRGFEPGPPVVVTPVATRWTHPSYGGIEIVSGAVFVLDDSGRAEVSEVEIVSVPKEGVYRAGDAGERITVAVRFDEELIVFPSPDGPSLSLVVGDAVRTASYDPQAGGADRLVFSYTPALDDLDGDGVSVVGAVALNGARIIDRSGVAADLSLGSHEISNAVGHAVEPAVFNLSLSPSLVYAEEDATAEITVHITPAPISEVLVRYAAGAPGDASAGDYVAPGTVTVAAGATTATIRIFIVDDEVIEPPAESFTVSLIGLDNAQFILGFPDSAQVVIRKGVCGRTAQVQQAIMDAVGAVSCTAVTTADLARIETLPLNDVALTSLKAKDFDGLVNLRELNLRGNELSGLPAGIFSDPSGLSALDLSDNLLSGLPAGLFTGLGGLRALHLGGNPKDAPATVVFTLNLHRVDATEDTTAVIAFSLREGAPFELTPRLAIRGGILSDDEAVVAAGATESETVSVTRDGEIPVTVTPMAPMLPVPTCASPPCYTGFEIVVGEALELGDDAWSPLIIGLEIVSDPAEPPAYAAGETIRVAMRFSEQVVVADPGALALVLEIGDHERPAAYDAGMSTTNVLVFGYRVASADLDADGVGVTMDSIFPGLRPHVADLSGIEIDPPFERHRISNAAGHGVWWNLALEIKPSLIEVEQGRSTRIAVTSSPNVSEDDQSAVVPLTVLNSASGIGFSNGQSARTTVRLTASSPSSDVVITASQDAQIGSQTDVELGPDLLFEGGIRFETPLPVLTVRVTPPQVSIAFDEARLRVTAGSTASATLRLAAQELKPGQTASLRVSAVGVGLRVAPEDVVLTSRTPSTAITVSALPSADSGTLQVIVRSGVVLREAVALPVDVAAQDVALMIAPAVVRVEQGRSTTTRVWVSTVPPLIAGQSATVTLTPGDGVYLNGAAPVMLVLNDGATSVLVSVSSSPTAELGTAAVGVEVIASRGLSFGASPPLNVSVVEPQVSVAFDVERLRVTAGSTASATLRLAAQELKPGQTASLRVSAVGAGLRVAPEDVVLTSRTPSTAITVSASPSADSGTLQVIARSGVVLREMVALPVDVVAQDVALVIEPAVVRVEQGRSTTTRVRVSTVPPLIAGQSATVTLTPGDGVYLNDAAPVMLVLGDAGNGATSVSVSVSSSPTAPLGASSVGVKVIASRGLAFGASPSLNVSVAAPQVSVAFDEARLRVTAGSTASATLRLAAQELKPGQTASLRVSAVGAGLRVAPEDVVLTSRTPSTAITVSALPSADSGTLQVIVRSGVVLREMVALPVDVVAQDVALMIEPAVVRVEQGRSTTTRVWVSTVPPLIAGQSATVTLTPGAGVYLNDAPAMMLVLGDAGNGATSVSVSVSSSPTAPLSASSVGVEVIASRGLAFGALPPLNVSVVAPQVSIAFDVERLRVTAGSTASATLRLAAQELKPGQTASLRVSAVGVGLRVAPEDVVLTSRTPSTAITVSAALDAAVSGELRVSAVAGVEFEETTLEVLVAQEVELAFTPPVVGIEPGRGTVISVFTRPPLTAGRSVTVTLVVLQPGFGFGGSAGMRTTAVLMMSRPSTVIEVHGVAPIGSFAAVDVATTVSRGVSLTPAPLRLETIPPRVMMTFDPADELGLAQGESAVVELSLDDYVFPEGHSADFAVATAGAGLRVAPETVSLSSATAVATVVVSASAQAATSGTLRVTARSGVVLQAASVALPVAVERVFGLSFDPAVAQVSAGASTRVAVTLVNAGSLEAGETVELGLFPGAGVTLSEPSVVLSAVQPTVEIEMSAGLDTLPGERVSSLRATATPANAQALEGELAVTVLQRRLTVSFEPKAVRLVRGGAGPAMATMRVTLRVAPALQGEERIAVRLIGEAGLRAVPPETELNTRSQTTGLTVIAGPASNPGTIMAQLLPGASSVGNAGVSFEPLEVAVVRGVNLMLFPETGEDAVVLVTGESTRLVLATSPALTAGERVEASLSTAGDFGFDKPAVSLDASESSTVIGLTAGRPGQRTGIVASGAGTGVAVVAGASLEVATINAVRVNVVTVPAGTVSVEQGRSTTFAATTEPLLGAGQSASLTLTVAPGSGLSLGGGAASVTVTLGEGAAPVVTVTASPTAAIGSTAEVGFSVEPSEGLDVLSLPSLTLAVVTPRVTVSFDRSSALPVPLGGVSTVVLSFEEGALSEGQSATLSLSVRGVGFRLNEEQVVLTARKTTAEAVVGATGEAVSTGVLEVRALRGVVLRSAAALPVEAVQYAALELIPWDVEVERGRSTTFRARVVPALVADRAVTVVLTFPGGFSFDASGARTQAALTLTSGASSTEVSVWSRAPIDTVVAVSPMAVRSSGLRLTGLQTLGLKSTSPRVTLAFAPPGRLGMTQRSVRSVRLSISDYDFRDGHRAVLNVGVAGAGLSLDSRTVELSEGAPAATVVVSASVQAATSGTLRVTAQSGVVLQAEAVTLPIHVERVFGLSFGVPAVRVTAGSSVRLSVSLDVPPAEGEEVVVDLTTGGDGVSVTPSSVTLSAAAPEAAVFVAARTDATASSLQASAAPDQLPNAHFVSTEIAVAIKAREFKLSFDRPSLTVTAGSSVRLSVSLDAPPAEGEEVVVDVATGGDGVSVTPSSVTLNAAAPEAAVFVVARTDATASSLQASVAPDQLPNAHFVSAEIAVAIKAREFKLSFDRPSLTITAGSSAQLSVSLDVPPAEGEEVVVDVTTGGNGVSVTPSSVTLSAAAPEATVSVVARADATGSLLQASVAPGQLPNAGFASVEIAVAIKAREFNLSFDRPLLTVTADSSAQMSVSLDALPAENEALVVDFATSGNGVSVTPSSVTLSAAAPEAAVSVVARADATASLLQASVAPGQIPNAELTLPPPVVVSVAARMFRLRFDPPAPVVPAGSSANVSVLFDTLFAQDERVTVALEFITGAGINVSPSSVTLSGETPRVEVSVAALEDAEDSLLQASVVAMTPSPIPNAVFFVGQAIIRAEPREFNLRLAPPALTITADSSAQLSVSLDEPLTEGEELIVTLTTGDARLGVAPSSVELSAAAPRAEAVVTAGADAEASTLRAWVGTHEVPNAHFISTEIAVAIEAREFKLGFNQSSLTVTADSSAQLSVSLDALPAEGEELVVDLATGGNGVSVTPSSVTLSAAAPEAAVFVAARPDATASSLQASAASGQLPNAHFVLTQIEVAIEAREFKLGFDQSSLTVTAGSSVQLSVSLDKPPAEGEELIVTLTTGGNGVSVTPSSVTLSGAAPEAAVSVVARADATASSLQVSVAPNQLPNAQFTLPPPVVVSVVREVTLAFEPAVIEVNPRDHSDLSATFVVTVAPALADGRSLRVELRSGDVAAVSFEAAATTEVRLIGEVSAPVTINVSSQTPVGSTVEIEITAVEGVGAKAKQPLPGLPVRVTGSGVRLRVRVFLEGALE